MKKISDAWYKNKTWNGDIDTRFEKQLRYTRNAINRARFLQVQGGMLLDNPADNIQEVGEVILGRLFEDHPTEYCSVLIAQEKLGDYFYRKQQFAKAAGYYKIVMEYCVQQQSRTNTSLFTDLKWARTQLHLNLVEQFEKAYELVLHYPPALLKTAAQKFYHAELGALLCERMYKKTEMLSYANAAIEQAAAIKPGTAPSDYDGDGKMEVRVKKLTELQLL